MWDRLRKALGSDRSSERVVDAPDFHVYRTTQADGLRDVIALLPEDVVFKSGLAREAIVGVCAELLEPGQLVTAANFRPNPLFADLLHAVIATHAPELPELGAEAERQGEGWVYLVDARTPTPAGDVPPHDILGRFAVREGRVVPTSYEGNGNHRLWSDDGVFRLDPRLHARLLERLRQLPPGERPAGRL